MTVKAQIEAEGGLLGQQDIARLFDVSPQRAHQLVREPTFPAPVTSVGKRDVWLQSEVVQWRKGRQA